MRTVSPASIVFGLLVASMALACSASGDETGVDEGATRIDPEGTDSPGKLLVKLPAGAAHETKVSWQQKTQLAGQALEPLPIGEQPYALASGGIRTSGKAQITTGATTTVLAALVGVDAVSGPRTMGLRKDPTNWGIQLGHGGSGSFDAAANGATAHGLLAGEYEINFGVGALDGVPVKVVGGDTKKVVLADPAARRVTRIIAPAQREYPTASCYGAAATAPVTYQLSHYNYQSNSTGNFSLEDAGEIDVGIAPSRGDMAYSLSAPGQWRNAVQLPMPAQGQPMGKFQLGRIDVNDVLINSTQPRVPGTYRIFRATPQGQASTEEVLGCAPATKTGVDLPPGKYVVRVQYNSVESGPKTDDHVVTVP